MKARHILLIAGALITVGSSCEDPGSVTSLHIEKVSPDVGSTKGGTTLTIVGTGFNPGTKISIGGITTTSTWISNNELSVLLPEHEGIQGYVPVSATNADGESDLQQEMFSYYTTTMDFDTLKTFRYIDLTGEDPRSLFTVDFDHDKKPDILYANKEVKNVSAPSINVILASGTKTTTPVPFTPSQEGTVVKDINQDGNQDVIFANPTSNEIEVLLGKGDGTFDDLKKTLLPGTFPDLGIRGIEVADINKDGKFDVIFANEKDNSIGILLGQGDGTFETTVNKFSTDFAPKFVQAADFDQNGQMDVAIASSKGVSISVMLNRGNFASDFNRSSSVSYGSILSKTFQLVVKDYNRDGHPDILALIGGAPGQSHVPQVVMLPMKADGQFGPSSMLIMDPMDAIPSSLDVVDMDGDQVMDLVAMTDQSIQVFRGKGNGELERAREFYKRLAYADVRLLKLADMNADGKLDFVISYSLSDAWTLIGHIEIIHNVSK